MKKAIIYIFLFVSGIIIGSLVTMDKNFMKTKLGPDENACLTAWKPVENNKEDFKQSAYTMLGKSIIVKGNILEVYKNQYNEAVVYLKDFNIPVTVTCSLFNSENQVKKPFRLGETISLQGTFTELNEEMHLENCRIVSRSR
jgi:hypothetical protein